MFRNKCKKVSVDSFLICFMLFQYHITKENQFLTTSTILWSCTILRWENAEIVQNLQQSHQCSLVQECQNCTINDYMKIVKKWNFEWFHWSTWNLIKCDFARLQYNHLKWDIYFSRAVGIMILQALNYWLMTSYGSSAVIRHIIYTSISWIFKKWQQFDYCKKDRNNLLKWQCLLI